MTPTPDDTPATGTDTATPGDAPSGTETPATPASAFEWLGGEARVRQLVDHFYDLMDLEPAFRELRAAHGSELTQARDKLFWFLCGWLGGPNHYIERHGHPRLRARHMPFSIGIRERDQWLACMHQSMLDCAVDPALIDRLTASFANTADWMRNR